MNGLSEYLREAGRKPFAWGGLDPASRADCDCMRFIVDWVERVMGVDPLAEYRGTYDTERGARRIMKAAGGPVAFVESLLEPVGMRRIAISAQHPGDVGLVHVGLKKWRERMVMVPAGAICISPRRWAVKAKDAMIFADLPVLAAWALPRASSDAFITANTLGQGSIGLDALPEARHG